MADKTGLTVSPPSAVFANAAAGTTASLTLRIKNVSKRPRTIRAIPPFGKDFSVANLQHKFELAPGLETTMTIQLRAPDHEAEVSDKVVLQVDGGSVEVPLRRLVAEPRLVVDPVLDFGAVIPSITTVKEIQLRNTGTRPAVFSADFDPVDGTTCSVNPPTGTLQPGRSMALVVSLAAEKEMTIGIPIRLTTSGADATNIILAAFEVKAGIVAQKLDVFFPKSAGGAACRKVDFGNAYAGVPKAQFIEVSNNGPRAVSFRVMLEVEPKAESMSGVFEDADEEPPPTPDPEKQSMGRGEPAKSRVSGNPNANANARRSSNMGGGSVYGVSVYGANIRQSSHNDDNEQSVASDDSNNSAPVVFRFEPTFGEIPPFSRTKVKVVFHPMVQQKSSVNKVDSTLHAVLASFAFIGQRTIVRSAVIGRAILPGIKLHPPGISFGETAVHAQNAQPITITNRSTELPVTVQIGRGAYFKTEPSVLTIPAGDSLPVKVVYQPNNMGAHSDMLRVRLFDRERELKCAEEPPRIRAEGTALVAATLRSTVSQGSGMSGGLRGDAERTAGGKGELAATQRSRKPATAPPSSSRKPMLEKPEILAMFETLTVDPRVTLSLEQAQERAEHKAKYNQLARRSLAATELKESAAAAVRVRETPDEPLAVPPGHQQYNDVTLGLRAHSGLRAPDPGLARPTEPVWLAHNSNSLTGRVPPRNFMGDGMMDEVQARTRFPEAPTNQLQFRECTTALLPSEIIRLEIGPTKMDLGQLVIGATAKRVLTVVNHLRSHVLVAINVDVFPELHESQPASQVVPPGAVGRFLICCNPHMIRKFAWTVPYTINGIHEFEFKIAVQTVPPTLKLSREDVTFKFASDNWENSVSESVVLTNPNTHQADFGWEMSSPVFSVTPNAGSVPGRGQVTCVITWVPGQQPELNNGVAVVRIDRGASSKRIRLIGEMPKASAAFDTKVLTLKPASVGVMTESTVLVKNTGGVDAVFFVEQPADQPLTTFSVAPMRGRVAPGSSMELTVRFSAISPAKYSVSLPVFIRGGDRIALPIVAEILLPDVSVVQPLIDFGKMSQGSTVKQKVTIQNTSPIAASLELDLRKYPSFSVNLPASSWSSDEYPVPPVRPITGKGHGGGGGLGHGTSVGGAPQKRSSQLSVRSSTSRAVSNPNFFGDKPERPPHGLRYQVDINPQRSISFELVYVADEATADDTDMEYDGAPRVPTVDMVLPLSLANTNEDALADGSSIFGSRPTSVAGSRARTPAASSVRDSAEAGIIPDAPGTASAAAAAAAAAAPSWIDEHTAAVNSKLRCRVVAYCLRPRLSLSDSVVDFEKCTVIRERVKRLPYQYTVTMVNESKSELQWNFGLMTQSNAPRVAPDPHRVFTLSPTGGRLAPGQMEKVTISFTPRTPAEYGAIVPVYLDGQKKKAYILFEIFGHGVLPRLSFSTREVALPAVPLGVTSRATVFIESHGYDNLAVMYKLPQDKDHAPIELTFPEGNVIGLAKDRLPVVVSFKSAVPTAFTAPVEFLDDDGHRFSLPVVGIAEPSALTCAQFFMVNANALDISAPDHSTIKLVDKEYRLPEVAPGKFGIQHSPCLMRWLNTSAAQLGPFDEFPGRFLTSRGKLLIDLIEQWSGEKIAEKVLPTPQQLQQQQQQLLLQQQQQQEANPAAAGAANPAAAAALEPPSSPSKGNLDNLVQTYERILVLLRSAGACVNLVKPEHLLDQDDMIRFLNTKEARLLRDGPIDDVDHDVLAHWRIDAEEYWAEISTAAWHAVLFEVVKVYAMSRASPKALKGLAGMDQAFPWLMSESTLSTSPLYSSSECALLSWITHHFSRGLPQHSFRVKNFTSDLRNGYALLGLVSSHSPFAADLIRTTLRGARLDERENARLLLEVLVRLQLDFSMTEDELVRPVEHEMVLFLYYLFTSLPALLPRNKIEFHSRLQERSVKNVVVSNPTPRRMTYEAHLEGALDFSLEKTQVQIEPRSSATVSVVCVPHSSRPAEGRLILAPHSQGAGIAATVVFALHSIVNVEIPLQTSHFEGRIYEMLVQEVEVENPFSGDCDFTVTLTPFEHAEEKKDHKGARAQAAAKQPPPRITEEDSDKDHKRKHSHTSMFPPPFGCDRTRLRLRRGEKTTVQVYYLPFAAGHQYARLRFEDNAFGPFVYELHGESSQPAHTGPIKTPVDARAPSVKEVALPFMNPLLESAKKAFLERHPGSKDKSAAELVRAIGAKMDENAYTVEVQCPYVSAPAAVVLQSALDSKARGNNNARHSGTGPKGGSAGVAPGRPPAGGAEGGAGAAAPGAGGAGQQRPGAANVLPLTLNPSKGVGVYNARIVLTSPLDVRIINVEFTATAPSATRAALDFECAARSTVMQEIPLHNNTERQMVYSANFSGSTAQNFWVTREVVVGPRSHSSFQLTFAPRWIGRVVGEVVMKSSTGETSTFMLAGKSTEPLAESNLVLETSARVPVTQTIRVPNVLVDRDVTYEVSTEVGVLSGAPTLAVRANGTGTYDITASPIFTGALKGTLTFTASQSNGEYIFYTVEIITKPPIESGNADLAVEPGKAVLMELPIGNPLKGTLDFTVHTEGSNLYAPQKVVVPPHERRVLEVAYCPQAPAETWGQLRLMSQQLGEFRFGLGLKCAEDIPDDAYSSPLHRGGGGEEEAEAASRFEEIVDGEEDGGGRAADGEGEAGEGSPAGVSGDDAVVATGGEPPPEGAEGAEAEGAAAEPANGGDEEGVEGSAPPTAEDAPAGEAAAGAYE